MSEKLKINFTNGSIKKEVENDQCNQHNLEQQQQHSCFYSSQTAVPSTILITNNYSSSSSQNDTSIGLTANDRFLDLNNKSSITILTRTPESDSNSNKMSTSSGGSTVVNCTVDRINICINNHPIYCPRSNVQTSSLGSESSSNMKESFGSTVIQPQPLSVSPSTATTTANAMPTVNTSTPSTVATTAATTSLSDPVTKNSTSSSITALSSISLRETSIKAEISINNDFSIGQDVLVQKKDGRYYLGTIVAISKSQSLVKFDDNTECWSPFEELTKLGSSGQNDEPMCVVCKKINKNDIVEVCERCGRGYHRKCADGSFQKKGIWYCRRCTAPNGFKTKKIDSKINNHLMGVGVKKTSHQILHKSQLPYNLDSLSWDSHHRVNLEQIYCYCGKNGEWYNKMLQCCKCQQWFHEKCVNCLNYPVFAGDRFYVFACTMCNKGKEFLRRLEMKWNDIVHLLLFNITLYNQRKYYHANKTIVPYALDNWSMLQLQPSMKSLSATGIKENILKTLNVNNLRFKCGKEIKKGHSFWGLRSRIPPPSPKVIVPFEVELTDQYLKEHKKLIIVNSIKKKTTIQYTGGNLDNESSSVTSDDDLYHRSDVINLNNKKNEDNHLKNKKSTTTSLSSTAATSTNVAIKETGKIYVRRLSHLIDDKNRILLNGFDSNDLSDKSHDCMDYDENIKDRNNLEVDDEDDDDCINDNRSKHKIDDNNKNSNCIPLNQAITSVKSTNKRKRKSPLQHYSSNNKKLKSLDNATTITTTFSSLTTTTVIGMKKATDTDTKNSSDIIEISDSSDETSSRGTLDLIIPPPKNFQGRNNPFRLTTPKKCENNAKISGSSHTGFSDKNQSAAGQFRIVRTVKRRLSAKDIMIGPNKEVKRRRLRKRSGNVEVISTSTSLQSLPKSAAFLPIRTNSKDIQLSAIRSTLNLSGGNPSVSNTLNGRRLRQRHGKNYSENPRRNSYSGSNSNSSNSSVGHASTSNLLNINSNSTNQINLSGSLNQSGNQSDVSLSELKTSVHMYFGGINRILSGESYIVRAKRFTPDGKIQYLIEWEGEYHKSNNNCLN